MPSTNWWESQTCKSVLLFLVTIIVNAVAKRFGYGLDAESIVAFAVVVIGFIAGRQYKSTKLELAAQAAATAEPSTGSPAGDLKAAAK